MDDAASSLPLPELVIALVGAVGSDLDAVTQKISISLSRFGYTSHEVRISSLFSAIDSSPAPKAEDERISQGMDAGTGFRERLNRGDALVSLAVQKIVSLRRGETPLAVSFSVVAA